MVYKIDNNSIINAKGKLVTCDLYALADELHKCRRSFSTIDQQHEITFFWVKATRNYYC